jgi:hypothetical protein
VTTDIRPPEVLVERPSLSEAGRHRWLKPGVGSALVKTTAIASIAVACPFSAWGSLTSTWARMVWLSGGRNHGTAGAHLVAGAICLAGIGIAWAIDPGSTTDTGKRRWRIDTRHYLSRILRWATTCGSLLYIPVAIGVIHLTTGAH